jgi:hypothetical protein
VNRYIQENSGKFIASRSTYHLVHDSTEFLCRHGREKNVSTIERRCDACVQFGDWSCEGRIEISWS